MPSLKFIYPLDHRQLQAFRSFYHTKFHQSLFYTTDSTINQIFLEFSDVAGDDTIIHDLVLDSIAAIEDCHASVRQLAQISKQLERDQVPCKRCGQLGILLPSGAICPTCGGAGRRPRKTKV